MCCIKWWHIYTTIYIYMPPYIYGGKYATIWHIYICQMVAYIYMLGRKHTYISDLSSGPLILACVYIYIFIHMLYEKYISIPAQNISTAPLGYLSYDSGTAISFLLQLPFTLASILLYIYIYIYIYI